MFGLNVEQVTFFKINYFKNRNPFTDSPNKETQINKTMSPFV